MVKVKVYYEEEKLGMCGLLRDHSEYVLESSEIELLKEDCLDVMEDYESGRDDCYRVTFEVEGEIILEVVNVKGVWLRYDNGSLIRRGSKFELF